MMVIAGRMLAPLNLAMTGIMPDITSRVLLRRHPAGNLQSAWIVDFKTDDVDSEEALQAKLAGYKPQITLYRVALSKLTGLAQAHIRCSLLFTRLTQLVEL